MKCDKNPVKIQKMFDEISNYYDILNNFISFGLHYFIKILAIKSLNIQPKSFILDLCCGTGDFSKIISKISPLSKVIGLDFSQKMLRLAKQKNPNGVFILGDSTNLPFKENEFDYITMGFGLRNIQDRQNALMEIYRVLKFGGKFLQLDFGNHNLCSKIFDIAVVIIVKILSKNSQHYKYLLKSKAEFPEPLELIKEFEQIGFKYYKHKNYLFGTISVQIMEK